MEKIILVDLNSGTAQMTEKQYLEHLRVCKTLQLKDFALKATESILESKCR